MNSFRCRSSSALRSTYTARVHLRICCCKSDAGRTHSPTGVHDRGLTTPAASRVPALAEATASPAAAATIAVNTNVPNQVANGPLQTSAKNSPLVWEQTDGGSQAYGALFLWLLLGNITALQQWGAAGTSLIQSAIPYDVIHVDSLMWTHVDSTPPPVGTLNAPSGVTSAGCKTASSYQAMLQLDAVQKSISTACLSCLKFSNLRMCRLLVVNGWSLCSP
jgi:hypothetical protein